MNRVLSFLRNRHGALFKTFLFLVAITVIVYLQPKQVRFKYDLSGVSGKPWHYESLIAPFEFPILKSKEELTAERTQLERDALPYYRYDSLKSTKQLYAIDSLLGGNGKDTSARTSEDHDRRLVMNYASALYRQGIMPDEDYGPDASVYVMHGNIAQSKDVDELLTETEADSLLRTQMRRLDYSKPLIEDATLLLLPNLRYDSLTTQKTLREAIKMIVTSRGIKAKDQLIISRGEPVDSAKFQELISYKVAFEEQAGKFSGTLLITAGQALLVTMCLLILLVFMLLFRREILQSDVRLGFVLMMVVLTVLMSYLPLYFENVPLQALPFCILPIVMRAFFDTRLALFSHLIATLIIGQAVATNRFEFVFVQLIAGIAAIFSIVNMRNRSQIFVSAGVIFSTYMLVHFGLTVVEEGGFTEAGWWPFLYFGISAGLSLVAYLLIYLFEKMFGFTSDVTLLELSDTNSTLLRELAEKAPGTFQHSLQVANLAEEAIRQIGGNALLVRTGALYHDIGKSDMPLYFIENQATGVNPHDELAFEESAGIIISHVIRGVEKAKENNIPDSVIDFIRTHHGTTNTAFFLTLYKKSNPDVPIDEELFRYPGPIPYSKETAVLMMADAVEASSRSLKKYDEAAIDDIIERIIDSQIEQDQFINADITFKDITTIRKVFKKKLMSIYHVRVEYPK